VRGSDHGPHLFAVSGSAALIGLVTMTQLGATEMLALATIAERLHYSGRDRERSVRRLFQRRGVPMIKRGRGAYFVTESQYAELIEKITTCSRSDAEANTSMSAVRSVLGGKRTSSKNILADRLAETMRKPTARNSKRKSDTKSFTVVEGGRTP
jgi:hypothetical protein